MNTKINLTLDEAELLALQTDYAVFAIETENNEINNADAGAFFLEGFNYAKKLIFEAQVETPSVSDNETKKKKFNPKYCNFWNTCEDHICNAGARCACDARIKF